MHAAIKANDARRYSSLVPHAGGNGHTQRVTTFHPQFGSLYFSSVLHRHGSLLDEHATCGAMPPAERPYHCAWSGGGEFASMVSLELNTKGP